MDYRVIAQTRQADGTIHASETGVMAEDLARFLEAQQAEAGEALISQEVYPA